MEHGFVKIPRALFESEAWKNASEGQKVFIIELYSRAAFDKCKIKINGLEVEVGKGEYVMSQRKFADRIGMSYHRVRDCQAYFEKHGIISSRKVTAQQNELCPTQSNIRATMLKINDIECANSDIYRTDNANHDGAYKEEYINSLFSLYSPKVWKF